MSAIEFEEVSKKYGDRPVLSCLSFQIESGERITIHGPSGCGKTTVLRLIAGFLAPDKGTIRIGDHLVAANGKIQIGPESRRLGMVFQDLALWPHLTVYQNLDFGLKAQGLAANVRKQRIVEVLARVRLEAFWLWNQAGWWDVTADGQRFIVVMPVEQAQVTELRRRRKTTSATIIWAITGPKPDRSHVMQIRYGMGAERKTCKTKPSEARSSSREKL